MPLSKEFLCNLFDYRDGEIYYKISRSRNKAGSKAGAYRKHDNAYQVTINGKHYLIHRIVFMMHHGYFPEMIDHIDGNRANNKIENLREATHSQNAHNAKLRCDSAIGKKNIRYIKRDSLWRVDVQVNKNRIYCGSYKDLELAELVAMEARNKFHGQFANHGVLA